jgi:hypothetical protein
MLVLLNPLANRWVFTDAGGSWASSAAEVLTVTLLIGGWVIWKLAGIAVWPLVVLGIWEFLHQLYLRYTTKRDIVVNKGIMEYVLTKVK